MKYIFIALIVLTPVTTHAFTMPRCYYSKTNMRYVPTRIYQNTSGSFTCYVNVEGRIKSMGVALLEENTGIRNTSGNFIYENDVIVSTTGGISETLIVTKKDDHIWGTGFYLMNETLTKGYGLHNNYGRILLANSVMK